jgi:methyl-accepting chemotaxis protein
MLRVFSNLPIFRRLFLAFLLAAILPAVIIVIMISICVNLLAAHGVSATQTDPLLIGALAAVAVSSIIVVTFGYIVNRTITQPLSQLATLARRIRQGETSARSTIKGRDEIYIVSSSINTMLDNIVRLIRDTEGQRDLLQGQVEKLVNEVSGVGNGDLRIRAEVTADALGVLADSFNYMTEALGALVVRVKSAAQEVEITTSNTYEQMGQLVSNADMQLQSISAASEVVNAIAQSSNQVSERTQLLDNAARRVRTVVDEGRSTVTQTLDGMSRINQNVQQTAEQVQMLGERSREIGDIVNVIDSIAHQTNRLALDAAIQAAMAGENGKGFGTVADDIRRLAGRAKEQVSMISRIVKSVRDDIDAVVGSMQETQRETSSGTDLMQGTGSGLNTIFSLVEQQARDIGIINQMTLNLLQSSGDVSQIMHNVSDVTVQGNVNIRAVSEEMEKLRRLANQLLASVEAFKVQEAYPQETFSAF